jgi:hypothetical protein
MPTKLAAVLGSERVDIINKIAETMKQWNNETIKIRTVQLQGMNPL